ncbi:hypothetical protein PCANC_17835 [Puccinia coronata f. sp. avenae]|uniref:Uncharacterized protein n=1 Tax=Puccinia coronata f. sp. avenae TaxID=200324 RepID=A0A2N5SLS0_9BASI|nr:hypothetical protein PCANC_17835 [Puccinia coronata f. sp. avenae]
MSFFTPHLNTIVQPSIDYPFVSNISDVVPSPTTFEIEVPNKSQASTGVLNLFHEVGGAPVSFPTNPLRFTIPGNTLGEAQLFSDAMCKSVLWNRLKLTQNQPKKKDKKKKDLGGRPPEFFFKLDHQCPRARHLDRSPFSRKKHPSRKCGCQAWFHVIHHIASNSLRVTWYWAHNHDLGSISDIVASRLPPCVEKWLDERVVSGASCSNILKASQSPSVLALENANAVASGRAIGYDQIRYLIKKRANFLAKKDSNVFNSLSKWQLLLESRNWTVHASILQDSPNFVFAFYSPWQRQMLVKHGQRMIMIDSTHNSVSNYFLSNGKKASLFSILIRDPLTGKGLPIAWAFTGSSAETSVHNILRWLRESSGVVPQAVMSDCDLAISNAVEAAYSDLWDQAPKHYWCLFHVMKAFKENAKSHLKDRADEALTDFRGVVYSQTDMTEL